MLLEGKMAVITGAGSGVGRASARRFCEEGASVVCADIDLDLAKETVSQVEAAGGTAVANRCDVSREADVASAIATAVTEFGRLDVMFNNVGIPTPRLGTAFEEHTMEDFERLTQVNFGGVFLGCKHALVQFKKQGGGGAILNTGSVAGLVGWGGTVYGATKGAVHQLTRAVAIEAAPHGIRVNAICPAGMPFTNFMAAGGGMAPSSADIDKVAQQVGSQHPLGPAHHGRGLRGGGRLPVLRPGGQHHRRPPSGRRRLRGPMSDTRQVLDLDRVRKLFDLAGNYHAHNGGNRREDPYPVWHALRDRAPVHEGTVHELSGIQEDISFHGLPSPDRPHFSAFSWAACDAAYRDAGTFASSSEAVDLEGGGVSPTNSMLSMGGAEHRRYRALVQPSFSPTKANWWIRNWIETTVHGLIDCFEAQGRCELNVEFCAAIPVLTITGSFGVPIEQALDIREALFRPEEMVRIIAPIVAARRERPRDDLISILVEAEMTDEEGRTHRLTDAEIYSFSVLLLAAGSGTTWKQLGITLAALLQRPEALEAVRADRSLLRSAIEESLRWNPTDPMFSRWVTEDVDFYGVRLPRGAVLHICLGAANRDPTRWERPDDYDIFRPLKPTLAFGGGPHSCLGQHVARAEMNIAINALLDRLPNLRLDSESEPPQYIGFYERGATAIPVVFG